jgi:hypothetical protein
MSNDKPLFSWQVFNRDAGFADRVRRQPHAPRQVLIMNMSETLEVPLPAGAAYYLAWCEFRTGTAKQMDTHFIIRLAFNDKSWLAGIECVL